MSFIFISHARINKPQVRPIVDALRAEGFKTPGRGGRAFETGRARRAGRAQKLTVSIQR
jgi:hypothetical protein